MNLDDKVTVWLEGLREGNDESAQQLWERYFVHLVRVAAKKLPQGVRRDFDEEDVALSAFFAMCEGVKHGKFPRLDDRDNLWSLLVVITARKVARRLRNATAQKRGGGDARGESALGNEPSLTSGHGIGDIIGREPSADFAAEVAEESERLLNLLPDSAMRNLAVLKMEGYSNQECAEKLDCGLRTVERRLNLIRTIWGNPESESYPDS